MKEYFHHSKGFHYITSSPRMTTMYISATTDLETNLFCIKDISRCIYYILIKLFKSFDGG